MVRPVCDIMIGKKLLKPTIVQRGDLDRDPIFEKGLLGTNGAAEAKATIFTRNYGVLYKEK